MSKLVILQRNIESLEKTYQLEILDFISKIANIHINENDNGIYINLSLLIPDDIIIIEELVISIYKKIEDFELIEEQKRKFKQLFENNSTRK